MCDKKFCLLNTLNLLVAAVSNRSSNAEWLKALAIFEEKNMKTNKKKNSQKWLKRSKTVKVLQHPQLPQLL